MGSIDVAGLSIAIKAELKELVSNPPSMERTDQVIDEFIVGDNAMFLVDTISPLVHLLHDRMMIDQADVLGGPVSGEVGEGVKRPSDGVVEVSSVGCEDCLRNYGHVRQIAHGADGSVHLLKSGKLAKVSSLHTQWSMRHNVTDSKIVQVLCEMDAARVAGMHGISPKVHDTFLCGSNAKSVFVIVMDNVDGTTLNEWIRTQGRTDSEKQAMSKVVQSMAKRLHSLGIFHEDLHAGNVLVDKDGKPWIIDFSRCTYTKTYAAYQAKHNDIASIKTMLSDRYEPKDIGELCQYIAARLIMKGHADVTQVSGGRASSSGT